MYAPCAQTVLSVLKSFHVRASFFFGVDFKVEKKLTIMHASLSFCNRAPLERLGARYIADSRMMADIQSNLDKTSTGITKFAI